MNGRIVENQLIFILFAVPVLEGLKKSSGIRVRRVVRVVFRRKKQTRKRRKKNETLYCICARHAKFFVGVVQTSRRPFENPIPFDSLPPPTHHPMIPFDATSQIPSFHVTSYYKQQPGAIQEE